MRLLVPTGNHIGERVVHVEHPHSEKTIAALRAEIALLKAMPVEQKVVERVVEKPVDNSEMVEKLNALLRENAELKSRKHSPRIELREKEVVREVPIEKVVYVDKPIEIKRPGWHVAAYIAAGLMIGLGASELLHKKGAKEWPTSYGSQESKNPLPARR